MMVSCADENQRQSSLDVSSLIRISGQKPHHLSSWLVPCALRLGPAYRGQPSLNPHMWDEPPQLLSGHAVLRSAGESFVHANGVLKRVLANIDAHPSDVAREPTLRGLVVLGDRRAGVPADIHQVVGGE
jgi:hypothetical protein